ncbi:hypothetical protein ABIA30_002389 [Mycobacterium sp. MAA66]
MVAAWIIGVMSDQTPQAPQTPEPPETPTDSFPPVAAPPVAAPVAAPVVEHKSSKLYKVLAWVGIVAGSVFIVATIFFSGYFMGMHGCGHHHGWHKHHHGQGSSEFRGDRDDRGPGGPGMWHPMFPGPGGPGFIFPGGPGFPGGSGGQGGQPGGGGGQPGR